MRQYYTLWLYIVILIAVASGGIQSYLELRNRLQESRAQSSSLAASLEESVLINWNAKRLDRISRTIKRLQSQQRLAGAGVCVYSRQAGGGLSLHSDTESFPANFDSMPMCQDAAALNLASASPANALMDRIKTVRSNGKRFQYYFHRLESSHPMVLGLMTDLTPVYSGWLETFARTFAITLILGVALLFFVTLQIRHWVTDNVRLFHRSLRSLIAGKKPPVLKELERSSPIPELKPITDDIDQLAKILSLRPRRNGGRGELAAISPTLSDTISKHQLVVVSNREPYIHQRKDGDIKVVRPASGLVTALEPILRQCGGLWIAHASGSADMDVVDENDEIQVPPENPTYSLKRVTLTREEEQGYYYGFANEGLWPLCHLAHTRPTFRLSDWNQYVDVNRKFAEAIPDHVLNQDSLFLLQDYHFALLPEFLKARAGRNSPKISIFWHIPWPNPETFGICPWGKELLQGMLGADVIGFHTQYHCNNFLEACNRYLEARIDYEHFSVTMGSHETFVRAFPIGIDTAPVKQISDDEVARLKASYGIRAQYVAVGVDRIDYTKGIIERCEGVEKFLERHPEYIGKFCLAQMGSPSRTNIPTYRALADQITETVTRINERFGSGSGENRYDPIVFLPTHFEWKDIQYFYQMGDVCMVTSLHDGMNLVAKEYVWCQKPERGSLILSKFTGAARELTEAFIVNPYSVEEIAEALYASVTLSSEEKARRMRSMKEKVRGHNAYKWASELIGALIKKEDGRTIDIVAHRPAAVARKKSAFSL